MFAKDQISTSCDKCQFKSISKKGLRNHIAFVHREGFDRDELNLGDHKTLVSPQNETFFRGPAETSSTEIETAAVNGDKEKIIHGKELLKDRPQWNGKILHNPIKMNRKHVSIAWMYGGLEENADSTMNKEFIRCGICGSKFRYRDSSTCTFVKHLKIEHMIENNSTLPKVFLNV